MHQTTRHTPSTTYKGYRLSHRYDGLSRRVWKRVETTTNGTTWVVASVEFFLYDGWNLVSRITLNNNLNGSQTARQNYVWGPDIGSRASGYRSSCTRRFFGPNLYDWNNDGDETKTHWLPLSDGSVEPGGYVPRDELGGLWVGEGGAFQSVGQVTLKQIQDAKSKAIEKLCPSTED